MDSINNPTETAMAAATPQTDAIHWTQMAEHARQLECKLIALSAQLDSLRRERDEERRQKVRAEEIVCAVIDATPMQAGKDIAGSIRSIVDELTALRSSLASVEGERDEAVKVNKCNLLNFQSQQREDSAELNKMDTELAALRAHLAAAKADYERMKKAIADKIQRIRDNLGLVVGQGLEESCIQLRADLAAKGEETIELRMMCAVAHCGSALYHDDGELQDSREYPWIDWKRDSVSEIRRKLTERALPKIDAALSARASGKGEEGM